MYQCIPSGRTLVTKESNLLNHGKKTAKKTDAQIVSIAVIYNYVIIGM